MRYHHPLVPSVVFSSSSESSGRKFETERVLPWIAIFHGRPRCIRLRYAHEAEDHYRIGLVRCCSARCRCYSGLPYFCIAFPSSSCTFPSWQHSHSQQIFKALHSAYRRSLANPFLRLHTPIDADPAALLTLSGGDRFKAFRQRVDEVGKAVSGVPEGSKA